MRSNWRTPVLWIFLPLVASCGVAVPYEQNRPPVPLITHQGELELSGGVHFPYASGLDFQANYAPWSHFSTYAGFQLDKGSATDISEAPPPIEPDYDNHFFEIGIGYFDTIPQHRYEAYLLAGYGTGVVHQASWGGNNTDTNLLSVFRIGIQQNIGIKDQAQTLGLGLGLGFEHLFRLQSYSTTYSYVNTGPGTDTSIARSSGTNPMPRSAIYVEPIFFWSFGIPLRFSENRRSALRFLTELWITYTTNSYPDFGGGNASFTLSLDF